MTESLVSWSSVVHSCRVNTVYADRAVTHVVRNVQKSRCAGLTDFQDAGYSILAVGLVGNEVSDCSAIDDFPRCQHLLLQRLDPDTATEQP